MKHNLLKICLLTGLSISSLATAQFFNINHRMDKLENFDHQKFSWGFFLNGSHYDYRLVLDPRYGMDGNKNLVTSTGGYGFGAGLIGRMRMNDYFDLRIEPGMQFAQRQLYFDTQKNDIYSTGTLTNPAFETKTLAEKDKIRNIRFTYLDIPILVEMHGNRWYNTRPYAAAGINYIMNLQSNSSSPDDNLQGTFRSTTHNFAWSAEMGIQIYFNRFKLTPGIRGTFFLNNEVVADKDATPPYWTKALSSGSSRAILFTLKFE
ncbi:porin family protein [Bergeyella zoohelcum]|uniref:type IX secretion/gliding motility protein PorT/SprT n=1 Tax=Bergeyella zoohelcum TaxID=1015 RepID=UPI002A92086D|nr:porin family protein [Bergeyella zoohelcum]MDY6026443.1 porin family protein [Bergeyella zoohelcum]